MRHLLDSRQSFGPVTELRRKIDDISPSVNDIWVIAATAEKYPQLSVFQVWPEAKIINIDLASSLSTPISYPDIIMLTSGLEENLQYEGVENINLETVSDL